MYFPKSQIRTGLHTGNSSNFIYVDTRQIYKGFYWKTSQGKFYAGTGPQEQPVREIYLTTAVTTESEPAQYTVTSNKITSEVAAVNNMRVSDTQYMPVFGLTLPTDSDYNTGYFNRYFCTKVLDSAYFEITKDTYQQLTLKSPNWLWELYNQVEVTWVLTGNIEDVYTKNKAQVQLASTKSNMPSLDKYIKNNYTKYYKRTV